MNIPILVLFFNRSDTVLNLINALRTVKPTKLYLACDGGRSNIETQLINGIRNDVLKSIDWDCHIETRFLSRNLGCKNAVSSAINWFFSDVEEGIVLEDDCIPSPSFFDFVAHCLHRYRDDMRIATIGGRRGCSTFSSDEIIFSSKFFCWGWASWSNRITSVDVEFGYQNKLPLNVTKNLSFWELRHVKGIHSLMLGGIVNSWAYSYDLHFRAMERLHVVPPKNFITNIGIGQGTHHTGIRQDKVVLELEPFTPVEPMTVIKNSSYMNMYFKQTYGLFKTIAFPYVGRIKKIQRIIGL